MFTGIVQRTSTVLAWEDPGPGARRLRVADTPVAVTSGDEGPWDDLEQGESIAVNGVCLTLVGGDGHLAFDVIPETLACTALGDLEPGAWVHLERSLRAGDRLGGHYVLGHVDAVGRVKDVQAGPGETILEIGVEPDSMPRELGFQVIPKGSVAIDGVSLTIVDRSESAFSVALVPHTLAVTRLGRLRGGDRVNLEMDHVGKWVMELLASQGRIPTGTAEHRGDHHG